VLSYYVSLRSEFRVVLSYYVSLRSEFRVVLSYYVSLRSDRTTQHRTQNVKTHNRTTHKFFFLNEQHS
jgi:hypothetical protein